MERRWTYASMIGCFGLLICLAVPGFALQCYECNSNKDPGCGDPFNKDVVGSTSRICDALELVCGKWVGNASRTVARGCTSQSTGCDYSRDSSGVENHRCGCRTDFCNGASHGHAIVSCLIVILTAFQCLTNFMRKFY